MRLTPGQRKRKQYNLAFIWAPSMKQVNYSSGLSTAKEKLMKRFIKDMGVNEKLFWITESMVKNVFVHLDYNSDVNAREWAKRYFSRSLIGFLKKHEPKFMERYEFLFAGRCELRHFL